MNLEELRNCIDKTDNSLLKLFLKRMEYTDMVADYKMKNNIPVLNLTREADILEKISKSSGDKIYESILLFNTIMDLSRTRQYIKISTPKSVANEIPPKKVAFAGISGSFASIAAKKLYKNCDFIASESFESVFKTVEAGNANRGILPCENSFAGSVTEIYDLLVKYGFYIVSEIRLPINHCLMGYGSFENLETVYSHPQAISQCDNFIKEHGFKTKPFVNTSIAAKAVMDEKNPHIAAIASYEAATEFSLNIIKDNIQSAADNTTRFISVSKQIYVNEDANKICIAFSLPHTSGSLYRALSKIAACGLNLTRIESRPTKQSLFEYIFYVEFNGNLKDCHISGLILEFEQECSDFYFLGNYNEII